MNYNEVAKKILKNVGGKKNIENLAHCSTRLRLVLKDMNHVNIKELENNDLVKGTFSTGGQFQIIIGAGTVNEVYKELVKLTGLTEMSTSDLKNEATKKQNPVLKFVKMLSDIFVPIIPAIVAGGLLMGLNNLFTSPDLFFKGKSLIEAYPNFADLASLINTFANAPFVFLPVLLGFSAAKRFGGNPYLGAALGMIMVHPDLLNGWGFAEAKLNETVPVWNIFGFHIQKVGYQGSVLPVLVSSFLLAKIETNLRKITPSWLDNLLVPLVSLFVTGILTFTLIGPITRSIGDQITNILMWLYYTFHFFGMAIFGLLYAPIVITGMHHSFIAVETQLLAGMKSNPEVVKGSFIFVVAAMSNVAQGAATLAMIFISKNENTKSIAGASGISALLGITEPAMFGINLKYRYPFLAAIIGASIGCAYAGLRDVLAVSLGAAGLPGFLSIRPINILDYFIAMLISMIIAFGLTFIFSKTKLNKHDV